MQMLKKIFKSDSKYYLELDEALESKPVQQTVETAKKAANVVQDKAAEVLESKPVQQAVETVKEAADVAQDKAEEVLKSKSAQQAVGTAKEAADVAQDKAEEVLESKSAKAKSGKKSVKKDSAKSKQKTEVKSQPSPQNSGASSFDPPFWVAAMYKNSSTAVNSDGSQAEQTFATDNLMPTVTKYRRTPGPSLSKFKDMAKKAKTPRR